MKLFKNILLGTLLAMGLTLVGCQSEKTYNDQKVVEVNQSTIYMDEMLYHVMITEFQGKVISSYFGDLEGYWKSNYEDGITMSEGKHKEILDNVIKYQIYFEKALEEGLVLSDEEREQAQMTVQSIKMNIGSEVVELAQLTDEELRSITEKVMLATKYYNLQSEAIKIDENEMCSGLNEADYEQCRIKYVFVPTKAKDTNGSIHELTKDQMEEALRAIEEQKVALSEEKEIDEENSDLANNVTTLSGNSIVELTDSKARVKKGEIEFTVNDHPFEGEEEIVEESRKLAVGETSEVFSTSKGYYVIKRLEAKDDNQYAKVIEEKIKEVKEISLQEQYSQFKRNARIKVNNKAWKKIEIGNTLIKE